MLIKSLMLYSYIVGAASSIVVAGQLVPHETMLPPQVVNRSLKGDRLPIQHAAPRTNGKIYIKVPARIAPSPKINIGCERPLTDVDGRCFANAGRPHSQVELT